MPTDVLVTAPGTRAAPLAYTIAPGFEFILKAASASFNGSGSGSAFLPCLRILDSSGHLVGQYITDSTVAAGSSADVSFAPFLRAAAAGGGSITVASPSGTIAVTNPSGPTVDIDTAFYHCLVKTTISQSSGSSAITIQWDTAVFDTSPGATMWSAGDPTNITAPNAGVYLAIAQVTYRNSTDDTNTRLGIGTLPVFANILGDDHLSGYLYVKQVVTTANIAAGAQLAVTVDPSTFNTVTTEPSQDDIWFSVTRIA